MQEDSLGTRITNLAIAFSSELPDRDLGAPVVREEPLNHSAAPRIPGCSPITRRVVISAIEVDDVRM